MGASGKATAGGPAGAFFSGSTEGIFWGGVRGLNEKAPHDVGDLLSRGLSLRGVR